MQPSRFPKVNDVILAEALRQLIPVAESGVRSVKTHNAMMAFRRAETVLSMWTRQQRGRIKKLGGPLAPIVWLEGDFHEDPNNPDPGQRIPKDCQRPQPIKKPVNSGMRHKFQWVKCEMCNLKKVLAPSNICLGCFKKVLIAAAPKPN